MVEIDWSPFDKYSEDTCTCRCGATFRSHAKSVLDGETLRLRSRKPCPACGRDDNLGRICADPEYMTIRRDGS